jgi:hypothetical protein
MFCFLLIAIGPVEKYKAIDDAYNANDKDAQAEARKDLAAAFRLKAKAVNIKYIAPPKSTDFAIVYVPTEGLFAELSSYRDPKTKELLLQELRTKYKSYNFRSEYFISTITILPFRISNIKSSATCYTNLQ